MVSVMGFPPHKGNETLRPSEIKPPVAERTTECFGVTRLRLEVILLEEEV
jgi:hypothetical protein